MANSSIYEDIAARTGGDIYIGVVGPVRSGKSTFIKQFMDKLVLPNITEEYSRDRANDELPQASSGRTIMTTEPKFIPEQGVKISIDSTATMNVRLIDCVGYIVPSALGYIENDQPRMVKTPWFEEPVPFNMAAEIGTKKVITEHSTIGLVITTDGSISDIPREEYAEAENRVIEELNAINKPFIVLYNCVEPDSEDAIISANNLSEKYGVPVLPVSCIDMDEESIKKILSQILYEFPVREITFNYPMWINSLSDDYWLKEKLINSIKNTSENIAKIRDISRFEDNYNDVEITDSIKVNSIDLGQGSADISITVKPELFYKVITQTTGIEIGDEQQLMNSIIELSSIKKQYMRVKDALDEVEATG